MTGWLLFKHAVSMLLRNKTEVLRIFLVPSLIIGGVLYVVLARTGLVQAMETGRISEAAPGLAVTVLITAMVIMLLSIWPIVTWHRYVLNEEPVAGFLPPIYPRRVGAYSLQLILIALIAVLSMVPVMLAVMVLAAVSGGAFLHLVPLLEPGLALLPAWIFLRLSVSLPEIAMGGKASGLKDTWRATADDFGPVFGLVLITVVLQFALERSFIFIGGGPVGIVWWVLASCAFGLIQISILTTLYGYYVEKRPI